MKININKTLLLCGMTGAMLCSSAYAANNGLYVGGQVGYGSNNSSPSSLNAASIPVTIVNTQTTLSGPAKVSVDNDGIAGRAFLGYQFNKYLSLEGGYTQYSDTTVNNVYGIKGNDESLFEGAIDGVVKGSLPITDRFSVYAKGGAAYVMAQSLGTNDSTSILNQQSGLIYLNDYNTQNNYAFRPTYGVGASFDITKRLSTDISWSQIVGGNNVPTTNFAALGLTFHI
jgi:opacity protein-like surface antigen